MLHSIHPITILFENDWIATYEQIADFKGRIFNSCFPTSVQWMEERGKILFGNQFEIFQPRNWNPFTET